MPTAPATFPTYRQDFEGGSTLAAACPELVDFAAAFAIDSSGSHALTGTHSLKATMFLGSNNVFSTGNDTLAGNVTLSVYMQNGSNNAALSIYSRINPAGVVIANTYLRALFGSTGIQIVQNNAGTVTTLNTPIAGAVLPTGVWLCLELRCNGTAISARVVRQDNGQFFVNTGTGSWSGTPQVQSGTATITGAGGFGFRGGDNTSLYLDDWILEPAIPAVDITVFALTSAGATQQLGAGGFTDPLHGVTWTSSDTSVATVDAAGLVTAVAGGTATISATGKRDTGQTATSTATVTTAGATGYSFSPPASVSGYANNPSGSFTVTPNGTYTGSVTITPSTGHGLTAFGHNWTASSTPWVFSITPDTPGLINLVPTNSGGLTDALTLTYGVLAQTLAVGPLSLTVGVPATVTFTGGGTRWGTFAPMFSLSGSTGSTIGSVTVLGDTSATALVTVGPTAGTITFTDSGTGATAAATVAAPILRTTWSYLGSVVGFSAGLVGTVGYTVLRGDGSIYAPRSTAGVFGIGAVGYGAQIALPLSGAYLILWDDGAGHQAFEAVIPRGVEPTSAALPGGLNENQALADIHAVIGGLVSGFVQGSGGRPTFLAPDGTTARLSGTIDAAGNRSAITVTPPV